jgi:hypothetical protein
MVADIDVENHVVAQYDRYLVECSLHEFKLTDFYSVSGILTGNHLECHRSESFLLLGHVTNSGGY